MDEKIAELQAEFDRCSKKIANGGKGLTFREGGQGAEAAYSQAYKELVRVGAAMKLRGKYRGR